MDNSLHIWSRQEIVQQQLSSLCDLNFAIFVTLIITVFYKIALLMWFQVTNPMQVMAHSCTNTTHIQCLKGLL